MDLLKKKGYKLCGAGENIEKAYEPAVFEKDGITVSVIAVCENEFGCTDKNKAGAAGFDFFRLASKIADEKQKGRRATASFLYKSYLNASVEILAFSIWSPLGVSSSYTNSRHPISFAIDIILLKSIMPLFAVLASLLSRSSICFK